MMRRIAIILTLITAATAPSAAAQHDAHSTSRPRANNSHLPPNPVRRPSSAHSEPEHVGGRYTNNIPHVNRDHWYGHAAPAEPRYHLNHPFPVGRFAHVGSAYRYPIVRMDMAAHRFWLPGGYYFGIEPTEWPLVETWCWDCGDDFVIYIDADHPGWYLLYNVHTGTFVHVQYMGM
jgi:hypothetical protein